MSDQSSVLGPDVIKELPDSFLGATKPLYERVCQKSRPNVSDALLASGPGKPHRVPGIRSCFRTAPYIAKPFPPKLSYDLSLKSPQTILFT